MFEYVLPVVGFAAGFIIGWLFIKSSIPSKYIEKSIYDTLNSQCEDLKIKMALQGGKTEELLKIQENLNLLRTEKELITNQLAATKADLQNSKNNEQKNQLEISDLKSDIENNLQEFQILQTTKIQLESSNKNLEEKLSKQKEEIEKIGEKFTNEFKVLAQEILEDKSKKFTDLNLTNMSELLKPLGENITEFKKKVEETYDKESKQRFSLEDKIKELVVLNKMISEEANNLTKALKGQTKTQGDWGEMILESILENSGLHKGREYLVQDTHKDSDENRLRPDVIVSFPDNRKIVIDSKVSLNAYERYSSSDNAEEQKKAANDHLTAVKNHINSLSAKNYQDLVQSLDFVMLFIPIEPAYLVAMQADKDLWQFAYKKRILLMGPTNLIAALKMIQDIWKRDTQNKNALTIANKSADFYDKLVGFVENLEEIGTNLDKTKKCYDGAMNKLQTGKGNLIGKSHELKKLGVRGKKELPVKYLELNETDEVDKIEE